jgi:hypothetical protein
MWGHNAKEIRIDKNLAVETIKELHKFDNLN